MFFGNLFKIYFLGGMDNWFFNKVCMNGKLSIGEFNFLGYFG